MTNLDPLANVTIMLHISWVAVHLAVAGDVYDGVFLCFLFSHEMSWMRSWT